MPVIKAPYNFVPFNKQVVSPHWINQISHDMPFKDGLSGQIEVKLTAKSPLFVRDGMGQAAAKAFKNEGGEQIKPYSFSQAPDGRYFIPGTSLKGMIRSVLEIMSFGRMEEKVNDHRYALRDLSGAMRDQYLAQFTPDQIHCGWLKKNDNNSYTIRDCGIPGRIGHDEIDRYFNTNFAAFFGAQGRFRPNSDQDKAAQKKYELFGDKNERRQSFSQTTFPEGVIDGGRFLYNIDKRGEEKGTLVFTGQPGVRKKNKKGKWTGHFYEFIFFEGDEVERAIEEKVMEAFFFAYYEHEPTKWSEDWKVWRKKLEEKTEIPVFFHVDVERKVTQLGLSYLYKLPYKYSVLASITHHQGKGQPDLSEAIFGHVINGQEQLRGRVHIGHAFSGNAKPADQEVREVLSGPKASYFPTYMRQEVGGAVANYQTFMQEGAEIAGWKRYPVHANGVKNNPPPNNNERITTRFTPLRAGAEFTFTLRYHNLRPIELGALLSALTFHGAENTFHSLGMAKPLGYGKVKVEILNLDDTQKRKYLAEFENYMNASLSRDAGPWQKTPQLVNLIAMAQEAPTNEIARLGYMTLDEHVLAKNNRNNDEGRTPKPFEALAPYTQLVGNMPKVPTYGNAEAIGAMQRQIETENRAALHQTHIEEAFAHAREQQKIALREAFLVLKNELKRKLEARRAAIAKEEETRRARENGLDLSGIDASKRDAFNKLVQQVEEFGRAFHEQTTSQIRSSDHHPNGYVPEAERQKIWAWLARFTAPEGGLSKRDRKQWLQNGLKNADMRKLAEWIGETEVRKFLDNLRG